MDGFLSNFFNWELIKGAIPDVLSVGLPNTLILSVISVLLGLLGGLLLAVMGTSRTKWLRWPARVYTDIFRGLPAVLTILIIGQGMAPVTSWLGPSPFPLAILALALITAAYMGEILRSGIQSVGVGQMEASRALGLSRGQTMRLVIVPQGVRNVLPAMVNQFIAVLKDTSLVYFLGLTESERELFRVGQDAAVTYANLSPLVTVGVVYLIITIPLTFLVNFIDNRLRVGVRPKAKRTAAKMAFSTKGDITRGV
ncbi:amino acid ABC transporter permease [Brevibacterium sp. 91QC2O2]|uniref:amino acid ABC transporter permease n=1 Tax=Brevibacterium sp. 91QC2O2 TaxID=2968458 RepID=UPI00211C7056|nr:amino acid ABC transporter permease [Brevibacterium sp. 91QC2O2]MCQ9368724.1 amino acid ABC transporter permease [Brevibacterium sp. 91QC2O2]